MKRSAEVLTDEVFDLLILGGGITGAGVALDAVLRGFRVALIDKGDFASGTSSASSKLVHGGLRYLEHADFQLVYEALHERRRLLDNAPHLVQPLRFVIPFYRGARVPPWKWRLGLTLYDLLAGAGTIRRSRPLELKHLQRDFPGLLAQGLTGAADYHDAQMDDARLCIAVLRSAAREGACITNYVEAVSFTRQEGAITGVRALDRIGGKDFAIRARQVLNAAGPWVDEICRLAGDSGGPYLQPTKGVHVIAPNPGYSAAFLLLHPADGRVFFVIPWPAPSRLGDVKPAVTPKILIGTTDTLHDGPSDQLEVTPSEINYLLEAYNRFFQPSLSADMLLGHFAGLRPLIRARSGAPSALSREFRLFTSPAGLLSAAGGKFTTYRQMAETITDTIAQRLRRPRRTRTRDYPLDGAPVGRWHEFAPAAAEELRRQGLSEQSARHLVGRYGCRALDVAAYLDRDPILAEPVVPGEPDLRVEFAYQRDHEMAILPADFLLRRTRLGLFKPELLRTPPAQVRGNG